MRERELENLVCNLCDALVAANRTIIDLIDDYDVNTGNAWGVSKMLCEMDIANAQMLQEEIKKENMDKIETNLNGGKTK